jgi:amino acid transporter
VAAICICVVVAGSLLGNSFVVSRMTVAASNKTWLPRMFGVVGHIGLKPQPQPASHPPSSSSKSDAPINAVILSIFITALYILFGSFRALLTLNGLGEYSFFFLTVLGAIILRYREPGLQRPYKPFVGFHVVFVVVSGFVVVRGAVFAPWQALVVVLVWVIGLVFYWTRRQWLRKWAEERSD